MKEFIPTEDTVKRFYLKYAEHKGKDITINWKNANGICFAKVTYKGKTEFIPDITEGTAINGTIEEFIRRLK